MDYSTYKMPFGKFKNRPIEEVPFTSLKVYYCDSGIMEKYPDLKVLIEQRYPEIYIVKDIIKARNDSSFRYLSPDPICESGKQCFAGEDLAKKALKLIKQDKRDHKKPIRTYFHEVCGFWHLTSETLEDHSKGE